MAGPNHVNVTRRGFLAGSVATGAMLATPRLTAAAAEDKAVAQRQHARKLHDESIVVVLHDFNPLVADLPHMRAGGVTCKVYHIGVDVDLSTDFKKSIYERKNWSRRALSVLREVDSAMATHGDTFVLARTARDVVKAKQDGKLAIMIGAEGAKLLDGRLEMLDVFHKRGLRQLQLRWGVPNQLVEDQNLTPFGRDVVKACDRLGVIVSLSHIATPAFYDVIETITKPPIVCHGAAARAAERRGDHLGDRELKALAAKRGVVGIHFYSTYLGPRPSIQQVVEQVDYIADVVGIDSVALGLDLFPTEGHWGDFQRAQGTHDISWAIPNLSRMPEVTEGLVLAGYSDADIKKVLGGNYLRVCREVFGA